MACPAASYVPDRMTLFLNDVNRGLPVLLDTASREYVWGHGCLAATARSTRGAPTGPANSAMAPVRCANVQSGESAQWEWAANGRGARARRLPVQPGGEDGWDGLDLGDQHI